MQPLSDARLLRDYAERGEESAFAKIVARHTDLIYSAALRQVYSPDLARDVTQSVFTDLARKARTVSANLNPEASLVGWLYRGTRFAARDLYRNETRRTQRERQAMEQLLSAPETAPDWEQLRPVLDDAMSELDDADRDAVLLRYFKNHDLRTVGATLGISDDAAQKRVSRAVERLREFFAKRGVTVGAGGLAVVISANAVQAAPIGLALTISTAAALTGTTLATIATITTTKAIAMTALQKTIVTATIAVLAGAGIYEARQASQLRDQVQTLQRQQVTVAEQLQELQGEKDKAVNQITALNEQPQNASDNNLELLKLRGQVGVLLAQLADARNGKKQSEQPPFATAREYYNRADRHAMNHEYDAQLEDLDKAIELDPNMADAYMERGNLYSMNLPKEKGGDEKAVADFTRCLEIKPDDFSARWNRATHYRSSGKADEAIADWTIIIQGDVDFSRQLEGKSKSIAGALVWRGQIYQQNKKDYTKAIADYTAAIQMNPNAEYAHRSRGECYELLGETEKAQQDFAIEPKN